MGFGGISVWSLLLILVIVMLLFGTKKLRSVGSDLGGAIKGFKSAMGEGEKQAKDVEDSVNKPEGEARVEHSEGETGTTSNTTGGSAEGETEREKRQSSS